MVKPNTYISANAPISDTGIVTSGISVARQLRRNRKITSTTSSDRLADRRVDLVDRLLDEDRRVVGDLDLHALRQRCA